MGTDVDKNDSLVFFNSEKNTIGMVDRESKKRRKLAWKFVSFKTGMGDILFKYCFFFDGQLLDFGWKFFDFFGKLAGVEDLAGFH